MAAAAALSQSRTLAGCKAMTLVNRKQTVKQVTNGSKYFMKRDGSFMVEINVAEGETEDQAVKRYMRAVVQSGVLNKLRNRRYKESRIEMAKRRLAEKAQARKLGIEEPTWEEFYGEYMEEARPFDEFFNKPGEGDEVLLPDAGLPSMEESPYYEGTMYDLNAYNNNNDTAAFAEQGGYINTYDATQGRYSQPVQQQQPTQGGYMQPQQQQQQPDMQQQ